MAGYEIMEDGLNNYFPNADIALFPMQYFEGNYQVSVTEKDFSFSGFVRNNFLTSIQSKNDCFECLKESSNIVLPMTEDLNYINQFIVDIYLKSMFNKIFEKIDLIPIESMYTVSKLDEINLAIISNLSDYSTSVCRLDKKVYSLFLNCDFKMTKCRKLLPVPTLSFFRNKDSHFKVEIAFNLEKQTIHLVNSYALYYDDFFEENMIFNFDTDLNNIFESFIVESVMPNIDKNDELGRQLVSLGDDIETKIRLLLMYSI